MKNNITITISAETHPNLYNLLTMQHVCDSIIADDVECGEKYDITHLIEAAAAEVFGE